MGCTEHANHGSHVHGAGCGHTGVGHDGHTDYLHDGHLHHVHDGHVDNHRLGVGGPNPDRCVSDHACGGHASGHVHGAGCGHEAIPHGEHIDYLVVDHLHHPHAKHCDDHGHVSVV